MPRIKFDLYVTQDNIDHGVVGKCAFCPLALAFIAMGAKWAYVTTKIVLLPGMKFLGGFDLELPPQARDFIYLFDRGCPVTPQIFHIDSPLSASQAMDVPEPFRQFIVEDAV